MERGKTGDEKNDFSASTSGRIGRYRDIGGWNSWGDDIGTCM